MLARDLQQTIAISEAAILGEITGVQTQLDIINSLGCSIR
jgi:hypothetical protein